MQTGCLSKNRKIYHWKISQQTQCLGGTLVINISLFEYNQYNALSKQNNHLHCCICYVNINKDDNLQCTSYWIISHSISILLWQNGNSITLMQMDRWASTHIFYIKAGCATKSRTCDISCLPFYIIQNQETRSILIAFHHLSVDFIWWIAIKYNLMINNQFQMPFNKITIHHIRSVDIFYLVTQPSAKASQTWTHRSQGQWLTFCRWKFQNQFLHKR